MFKFHSLCLLAVLLAMASGGMQGELSMDKLYRDLLSRWDAGYNARSIPITKPGISLPVDVYVGLKLIKLVSFENNVLSLDTWLTMQWNDVRLKWDPSVYDDISDLFPERYEVWIPDIVLLNKALGIMDDNPKSEGIKAILKSDGNLTISLPQRLSAYCYNDANSYRSRNGTFECILEYGSWAYNGAYVNPKALSDTVELSEFSYRNPNLEITKTSASRRERTLSCCPDPYATVQMLITFKPTNYNTM